MQIFCGPDIPVPLSMWNEIPSCLRFVSLTEQGKCHSLYEGKFGVHKSVHGFLKNRYQKLICSATVWRIINLCTLTLILYLLIVLFAFLFVAPYQGIRIPESRKILLIKFEILGFGIRNTAQGIQNPSSTDKYWNLVLGIRNPQGGIQNPRLYWIPLHGAICLFVCLFVLNRQSRAKTFKHFLNIF